MMFKNKKAIRWMDAWGEVGTSIFLVFGLLVSLLVDSAIVSYAVILISGIMVGRLFHLRRHKLGFCFILITAGYLVGYMIGYIFTRRGYWIVIMLLFFIGMYLGDYIQKKKYCK